jgi:hypothetical protein
VPVNQHLHTPDTLLVLITMELYPPKRAPTRPGLYVFALTFHEVHQDKKRREQGPGSAAIQRTEYYYLWSVNSSRPRGPLDLRLSSSHCTGHDSPRSRRACGSDESALRPTLFGTRSIVHLIVQDGDLIPPTPCRCFPFPKLRNEPCMGGGKLRAGTVHDPCPC